jgi:uncharacterized LabA/DUF88 family protein
MREPIRATGPPAVPRRTTVFVGGLNFHYGVANGFGERWVDPVALCRRVLDQRWHEITQVRFYTSLFVEGVPGSGDPAAQNAYHHVLSMDGRLVLRLGQFRFRRETVRLASVQDGGPSHAQAIGMREKRSDVNLAAELVHLAHLRAFEAAVVVSNDSDLTTALEIVRHELGVPVGLVNPQPSRQCNELLEAATFSRTIRRADVVASILPSMVLTPRGPVERPTGW